MSWLHDSFHFRREQTQGSSQAMNEFFDITTLIFLALAVFVVLRLRSVLGRRTGNERQPFDPYSKPEDSTPSHGTQDANSQDKVVEFPGKSQQSSGDTVLENKIDRLAPSGSALNDALRTILAADKSFDPSQFVDGAKGAYEMVQRAFAEGDRKTLDMLLASDVYEGFLSAIEDRESRGEVIEATFVGMEKAEIVEAQLEEDEAQITVRFRSQMIMATRDKDGNVVDGDPSKVADLSDLWTFARDTTSRNPMWKLIGTQPAD